MRSQDLTFARIINYSFIVLISVLLFSCASIQAQQIDKAMKSWLGASQDELLLEWGPPTYTTSDLKGGTIWVYEFQRQTTGTAYTTQYGYTYYNAPVQYKAVRQFFIDSNGIIYAYRWQGL